jgi:aquaporin Z
LGLVVAGPEAAHLYFVESVGTFFLVFTIGNVVIEPGAGPLAPIPIGSCLMVMIYAGGHVSGGHFNPAVSFGCWVRGALATKHLVPYIVYQILGSIIASNLVLYI